MERRQLRLPSQMVEVRDVNGEATFVGRPVVYDQWSELIYGYFRERILPGAFRDHLAESPDIIACVDHKPDRLLGRTHAGTLKIEEDDRGLTVSVPQPDTSYARDLAVSIKRGDIRGMSFVFDVVDDDWKTADGVRSRDVIKAKIFEVSFVIFPAYPQTEADLRAVGAADDAVRERVLARMRSKLPDPLSVVKARQRLAESY